MTCLQARELLPFMLSVPPETSEQTQALAMLQAWDGVISPDSSAAVRGAALVIMR